MFKLPGSTGIINNLFSYYLNDFIEYTKKNPNIFAKYSNFGGNDYEEVIMPYFLDFLI